MVELTVDGKKIKFNLKEQSREKALFEAWYSMSDMPKYAEAQLKITTDNNEHLLYKIKDISDCSYLDQVYEKKEAEEVVLKEDPVENLLDKYLPADPNLKDQLKKLLVKSFSMLSVENTSKLIRFCTSLMEQGLPLRKADRNVQDILMALIADPGDDVSTYVGRYKEYLNGEKTC